MRGTFIAKQIVYGIDTDCLKYSLILPIRSEKSLGFQIMQSNSLCVEPQVSITKRMQSVESPVIC